MHSYQAPHDVDGQAGSRTTVLDPCFHSSDVGMRPLQSPHVSLNQRLSIGSVP